MMRLSTFAALVGLAAAVSLPATAQDVADVTAETASETTEAPTIRLGIGDALAVTVFGRPDLTGVYPVGVNGMMRLPLIGRVAAAGLTLDELEGELSTRATEVLDFQVAVTVDVDRFRPVLVIGEVVRPGEQVYLPHMTARTAFAQAGGRPSLSMLPGATASTMALAERDLWRAQATLRSMVIRQAAIDALLRDADQLTLPRELEPHRTAAQVAEQVARQNAVIASERAFRARTEDATARQSAQLEEEMAALAEEGQSLQRQAEQVNRELGNMQSLADRGLTTSSRMLDLRQMKETVEAARHRQVAALTRARQGQVRLELAQVEADTLWRRGLQDEHYRLSREIQISRADLEAARNQLIALSEGVNATTAADSGPEATALRYVVTRNGPDGPRDMVVDAHTPLLPGDVLEVRAILPEDVGMEVSSAPPPPATTADAALAVR